MKKFTNPYQIAQAGLVLQHLLLDITDGNSDALDRFCSDPASEERAKITELFVAKVTEVVRKVSDLLKYFSTASLSKVSQFVARDKFVVNTDETAELKISCLGDNFQKWFLGKSEKNVEACEVKISRLLKNSLDKPILTELGDKAENALAHVYEFLKSADKKVWYIFYVKDVNGDLRAVRADFHAVGWVVDANSVERPGGWGAGSQVVSR